MLAFQVSLTTHHSSKCRAFPAIPVCFSVHTKNICIHNLIFLSISVPIMPHLVGFTIHPPTQLFIHPRGDFKPLNWLRPLLGSHPIPHRPVHFTTFTLSPSISSPPLNNGDRRIERESPSNSFRNKNLQSILHHGRHCLHLDHHLLRADIARLLEPQGRGRKPRCW